MPAPDVFAAPAPPQISRKCAACETEEEKNFRESRLGRNRPPVKPPAVCMRCCGPRDSRSTKRRELLRPRFGQDFSHVRGHTDATAELSAREVNAHAYTVGHNMVFDAGRFAPGTLAGQRLIAHELTHVMQQSGSDANRFSQSDGKRERSPICRTFGNVPMQVQRKTSCACGGGCPRCTSKTGSANAMAEQFLSPMVLLQASGRAGHLLQAKLTIGASNDPLEQEADRVADQVLAAPAHPAVSGAPPHIQRFTGQATGARRIRRPPA